MTAAELIKELEKYPPHALVWVYDEFTESEVEVDEVAPTPLTRELKDPVLYLGRELKDPVLYLGKVWRQ